MPSMCAGAQSGVDRKTKGREMTQPLVVAVMLTRDRPAMAQRAIESFRAQTYDGGLKLLIFDTTPKERREELTNAANEVHVWHYHPRADKPCDETIGALRNKANGMCLDADILVHWDDDDYSHSCRIEEQVALLQASGKECVGFRDLLFWDTRQQGDMPGGYLHNEAWLYRNNDARWVAGTSMCYWLRAWEACPFDDAPHEDQRWWMKNAEKCVSVSSLVAPRLEDNDMPRMVCGIHDGNTEQIDPAKLSAKHSPPSKHWTRVPEWDAYCAERMKL